MSRYNNHSGSGIGGSNNNDDFDDITLKLQKYSALDVEVESLYATSHPQFGDSLIVNMEDVEVLDGVVFRREDKPDTWKVFSPGKFYHVDADTGKVYQGEDGDEMSAQDVLESARIAGFSETFGGTTYFYEPVGVVIEATGDIATSDDLDVETGDGPSIVVGESSMLLSNKSWVRTLGKLLSTQGNDLIAQEENENGNMTSVSEAHGWMTTDSPELRDGLEGRRMEMFVIEEAFTPDDSDEEITYTTPILLDSKTGERITIDNGDADTETEAEPEPEPAVADGGSKAQESSTSGGTETPAEPDTPSAEATQAGADESTADEATGNVPAELDDLLDYFARTDGEVEPDELRDFAEDEVDDPDDVDWKAASEEVENRA